MLILSPTSTSFGIWREIPIPMYLEFFIFNITNVDDILSGKNVSIEVEEIGPYVYRESHIKVSSHCSNVCLLKFSKQIHYF